MKLRALFVAVSAVLSLSAEVPPIYNVQLNGSATTYAGPGQIGSDGDHWNNPTLANLDGVGRVESTVLVSGVALVDQTGAASAVQLSISALNYKGGTTSSSTGNAVAGLNDRALKFDWNGANPVPTVTLTLSGLPADAPVGLYVYGALDNGSYPLGSTWTLAAANGGGVGNNGYGGDYAPPAGRDVTRASSEGLGWDRVDGTTDGAGRITVVVTPIDRSLFGGTGAWWQTYLNGFQLQLDAAPVITGMDDRTAIEGASITLSPAVSGAPTPALQWQRDGEDLVGETGPTLILEALDFSQDGSVYALVATNPAGTTTERLTLTVIVPPAISDFGNQAVAPGTHVSLAPTVTGVPAPDFQWAFEGVDIPGATAATLELAAVGLADAGTYTLTASNAAGTTSQHMVLTVAEGDLAPSIEGLLDVTVVAGENARFAASVTGLPVPTIEWRENDVAIAGESASTLALTAVPYAKNGSTITLHATNREGSASASATLRVQLPPRIVDGPVDTVVRAGATADLTVAVEADPEAEFQWLKEGVPLAVADHATATAATLTIENATPADAGHYRVVATNAVGAVASETVFLAVHSAIAVTALSPAAAAVDRPADTLLTITFDTAPSLGESGLIQIFDLADPATPVDTIDLSLNNPRGVQTRSLGGENFNTYPVMIEGSRATIYPHAGVLERGRTYFVTIAPGVFTDATGAWFEGLAGATGWSFTTRSEPPANPVSLVVAADGSGDFATVQGALDSLPANNTTPTMIEIREGVYREIVNINRRHRVTLRGESRSGTVLEYPNNAAIAPGGSTHFRMSTKVNANDVTIENLTLLNSTPQGGGQAEALMLETNAARFVAQAVTIASRQDTILANTHTSQGYFLSCTVIGNFDYIWGGGNLFFDRCTIHTIEGSRSANVTAARTAFGTTAAGGHWRTPDGTKWSKNGFAFVDCVWTADESLHAIALAGDNGTPGGQVVWIRCRFDDAYRAPPAELAQSYNFWQFGNTDLAGASARVFGHVVALAAGDARLLAAQSAPLWLGGWEPPVNALEPVPARPVALGEGRVQLRFEGPTGVGYRLWAGDDGVGPFPAPSWFALASGVFNGEAVTYVDTLAPASRGRFYRVTAP